MINKKSRNLLLISLCGSIAASAAYGLTGEGDPVQHEMQERSAGSESPQAQFEAAQAELQQIASVLEPIQQETQNLPEVQEALLAYDSALVEEMKSINPEQRAMIQQRGELFEALITAGDPSDLEPEAINEFQANAQQFQEVRSALGETEMEAQNGEEVREQLNEYQEVFMAAIVEVDPRATELMQRQEELHRTLSQLQGQVMQN